MTTTTNNNNIDYTPINSPSTTKKIDSLDNDSNLISQLSNRTIKKSYRQFTSDNEYYQPCTIFEYFCALAECKGSIENTIKKLKSREFMNEIRLLCNSGKIDIYNIICKIGKGVELMLQEELDFIQQQNAFKYTELIDKDYIAMTLIPSTTTSISGEGKEEDLDVKDDVINA